MISINGALFVVIGMHLLGSGEWILMPKIIHMTPPSSLESESIRFGLGALSSFGRSTYTARSFTLVSRYCLSTSNSVRTAVITICMTNKESIDDRMYMYVCMYVCIYTHTCATCVKNCLVEIQYVPTRDF